MSVKPVKTTVCRRVLQVEKTYPIRGKRSAGRVHDIHVFKIFPPREPRAKPLVQPAARPLSANFSEWFEYFVNRIGATVEQLNAWQFNLNQHRPALPRTHPLARRFAKELDALAREMGIGPNQAPNPSQLRWPLNGVYVCQLLLAIDRSGRQAARSGLTRVQLITAFDAEPDYRLVTRCSVVLLEAAPQPAFKSALALAKPMDWGSSSSSSSLNTGSSSSSSNSSIRGGIG
jgi:hypothetical protein